MRSVVQSLEVSAEEVEEAFPGYHVSLEGVMSDTVLKRFEVLNIWKQGDQRAPHKPLLVLYALGR